MTLNGESYLTPELRQQIRDYFPPRPSRNGHSPDLPPLVERVIKPEDVATIPDLIKAGAAVEWLWEGWIPIGVLTGIAARGGTGKTRFCADLIRRVRHRQTWPDGTAIKAPSDALALWVVADNHHDEMVQLAQDFDIVPSLRLNASKAEPFDGVTLELPEDYGDLEARIKAVRPLMVIVDTVGNATDRNLSRQEDAKAFYQPLQIIARKYRCAILCLTHLNATGQFLGRRVLEKIRVGIRIEQYGDDEKRRLEVPKTFSKTPPPLGLMMGDKGNEYDNDPPERPAEELGLASAPKTQQAIDWLRSKLAGAQMRVSFIIDEAKDAGISVSRLYKAKETLRISESQTEGHKWWSLTSNDELPE